MTLPISRVSITAAILALFVSGCASPSRISLDQSKKSQIHATECVVGLQQQEITADINQSNISQATGGGLIAALIDAGINNSRTKDAEQEIVPVRDALVGYDIGQTLKQSLQTSLKNPDWLHLNSIDVRQVTDEAACKVWLTNSKGDVLLLVRPHYRLNAAFDHLTVSLGVYLQARPKANGADSDNPTLYFNSFSCVTPLLTTGASGMPRSEAATLWAANSGKRARQVMDESLAEVIRMLAFDLDQSNPPDKNLFKAPDNAETRVVSNGQVAQAGYVTHTENNRIWVRLPGGELYSLLK